MPTGALGIWRGLIREQSKLPLAQPVYRLSPPALIWLIFIISSKEVLCEQNTSISVQIIAGKTCKLVARDRWEARYVRHSYRTKDEEEN